MTYKAENPVIPCYTGEDAKRRAAQYESAKFEDVHRAWLEYLPEKKTATLVDIGAGSGRDAAALNGLGFVVLAVEPSVDMLAEARRRHPSTEIEWLQDGLPHLRSLIESRRTFDVLLISAVWMHLSKEDRATAMETIVRLMNVGARAVITLRHPC